MDILTKKIQNALEPHFIKMPLHLQTMPDATIEITIDVRKGFSDLRSDESNNVIDAIVSALRSISNACGHRWDFYEPTLSASGPNFRMMKCRVYCWDKQKRAESTAPNSMELT